MFPSSASSHGPRRTIVYMDGYNLYYSRLRGTPFKWLDVVQLCEMMLVQRDQNEYLSTVKLFTARALARFATHGDASVDAQQAYHRALKIRHEERLQIIYGSHSFDRSGTLLPEFIAGQPYDRNNRVRVWKLEEKKTDVNIAINMYRDVSHGRCERIILISNDSDAEPALQAIRADYPQIMIGVVMPLHPPSLTNPRRISRSLENASDWINTHLTDAQLLQAQLPATIATNKRPIRKPVHW